MNRSIVLGSLLALFTAQHPFGRDIDASGYVVTGALNYHF